MACLYCNNNKNKTWHLKVVCDCPYAREGIDMDCRICPYSDGEGDQ